MSKTRPQPAIIWGAKGHTKVLLEFTHAIGIHVVALFDNDPSLHSPVPSIPLYFHQQGLQRWLSEYQGPAPIGGMVAIGGPRGGSRLQIIQNLADLGIDPVTVIHPTAFVASSVRWDVGTQVLANASVCADVRLGKGCIINTGASVDHECTLGDGVHVAPNATLTGCIEVGDRTIIGAGAVVLPRLSIGSDVIVGAGAVVTKNVAERTVVYGNPARVVPRALLETRHSA